jgi:hypothetical protein
LFSATIAPSCSYLIIGLSSMPRSISVRKEIIDNVRTIIHFWLEGRLERLTDMIDDTIVMYLPHCPRRFEGKKAFFQALREYTEQTTIRRYDQSHFGVETHDGVSIAHYRFHMDYVTKNVNRSESGIDLFVFHFKDGGWRLVRRSVLATH